MNQLEKILRYVEFGDLTCSNIRCECDDTKPSHNKLFFPVGIDKNLILEPICPYKLIIRWTKLGLRYRIEKDFDPDKVIALSKEKLNAS